MSIFCDRCGCENRDKSKFCSKCGYNILVITPDGVLEKGVILDRRYEIKHLVKAGGMGAVYKAVDRRFRGKVCAIKEMLILSTEILGKDYFIKRFTEEARLLHELKHNNLPGVKNYFIEEERYYLVMDYIEGKDLEEVMKQYNNCIVPEHIVIEWTEQILDVLAYLHSQNPPIIYRDLKPANIMLEAETKKIILIDFGIARKVNPGSSTLKTGIGTPGFSPLEVFEGKPVIQSDIFSLGATMHSLLTGVIPRTSVSYSFNSIRKYNPKVSGGLEALVMKALEEKVEDRYESAAKMLEAVNLVVTGKITGEKALKDFRATLFCDNCGEKNRANAKFCGKCGNKMLFLEKPAGEKNTISCDNCGQENIHTGIFCKKCGDRLFKINGSTGNS